jgi:hypothetical protein
VKFWRDVEEWQISAAEHFDDPSIPVCQFFFRWREDLAAVIEHKAWADEIVCGMIDGELVLWLGPNMPSFPMPVRLGALEVENGELKTYGLDQITKGAWAMDPSLNAEGVIHGFIVLHGVPDPAPWEQRIILP